MEPPNLNHRKSSKTVYSVRGGGGRDFPAIDPASPAESSTPVRFRKHGVPRVLERIRKDSKHDFGESCGSNRAGDGEPRHRFFQCILLKAPHKSIARPPEIERKKW